MDTVGQLTSLENVKQRNSVNDYDKPNTVTVAGSVTSGEFDMLNAMLDGIHRIPHQQGSQNQDDQRKSIGKVKTSDEEHFMNMNNELHKLDLPPHWGTHFGELLQGSDFPEVNQGSPSNEGSLSSLSNSSQKKSNRVARRNERSVIDDTEIHLLKEKIKSIESQLRSTKEELFKELLKIPFSKQNNRETDIYSSNQIQSNTTTTTTTTTSIPLSNTTTTTSTTSTTSTIPSSSSSSSTSSSSSSSSQQIQQQQSNISTTVQQQQQQQQQQNNNLNSVNDIQNNVSSPIVVVSVSTSNMNSNVNSNSSPNSNSLPSLQPKQQSFLYHDNFVDQDDPLKNKRKRQQNEPGKNNFDDQAMKKMRETQKDQQQQQSLVSSVETDNSSPEHYHTKAAFPNHSFANTTTHRQKNRLMGGNVGIGGINPHPHVPMISHEYAPLMQIPGYMDPLNSGYLPDRTHEIISLPPHHSQFDPNLPHPLHHLHSQAYVTHQSQRMNPYLGMNNYHVIPQNQTGGGNNTYSMFQDIMQPREDQHKHNGM